eukprot:NODE_1379_length_1445_cov_12.375358_g1147_i0.p3 GENE.NODE_1379_length_1445_cov_12.375358_g1147_i0~~NODE_1379_length_1445_cov_12.375358_g1147_i0.p3  ORF type:complete len:172 (-),score=38.08 NODE_1379_length_1445_cov_12.375358_g1147_i0:65-580(-)
MAFNPSSGSVVCMGGRGPFARWKQEQQGADKFKLISCLRRLGSPTFQIDGCEVFSMEDGKLKADKGFVCVDEGGVPSFQKDAETATKFDLHQLPSLEWPGHGHGHGWGKMRGMMAGLGCGPKQKAAGPKPTISFNTDEDGMITIRIEPSGPKPTISFNTDEDGVITIRIQP